MYLYTMSRSVEICDEYSLEFEARKDPWCCKHAFNCRNDNKSLKKQTKKLSQAAIAVYVIKMTELVSRVLYALRRSNHLSSHAIADVFKPCGSATMKRASSSSGLPEYQGVAPDRVYSGSMLP